jgi:hypothetical protein
MGAADMGRCARHLGLDRNPMRRRVDRAQQVVMAVLMLIFLVAGPWLTAYTAGRAYTTGQQAEHEQRAQRHLVTATVIGTGQLGADETGRGVQRMIDVGWTEQGHQRTTQIPELPGDRAGVQRQIWVDQAGHLTGRPRDHAQTITDTTLAAIFSLAGVALPLIGLRALIRSRLDRRRYAQWDADWVRTAPIWTRGGKNPPNMR